MKFVNNFSPKFRIKEEMQRLHSFVFFILEELVKLDALSVSLNKIKLTLVRETILFFVSLKAQIQPKFKWSALVKPQYE